MTDSDRDITATVVRERTKLGNFIRQRVNDPGDAEEILQEVFQDFVHAYRLPEPIEQVSAWLFRVARNRIVDRFRKKREQPVSDLEPQVDEGDRFELDLPDIDGGPEAAHARSTLLDVLRKAIEELPASQREVFVAHEIEGRSFKEMAEQTGVSINTLLARKRYAVLQLRSRLQSVYDELDF